MPLEVQYNPSTGQPSLLYAVYPLQLQLPVKLCNVLIKAMGLVRNTCTTLQTMYKLHAVRACV